MGMTYLDLLKKVDSGEVEILEGVVKSKLGMEYPMSNLEPVSGIYSERARKRMIPLKFMKYTKGKNVTFLQGPNTAMGLYARTLDVKDGELTTKDVYLGDFQLEKIALGIGKFKSYLAAARTDVRVRLQELAKRTELWNNFAEYGGITLFGTENDPRVFGTDLYTELKNLANNLFKS